MGLFSFGSKEKPKAPPKREAKPDTITSSTATGKKLYKKNISAIISIEQFASKAVAQ